jgi:hypothetical protein
VAADAVVLVLSVVVPCGLCVATLGHKQLPWLSVPCPIVSSWLGMMRAINA